MAGSYICCFQTLTVFWVPHSMITADSQDTAVCYLLRVYTVSYSQGVYQNYVILNRYSLTLLREVYHICIHIRVPSSVASSLLLSF
jgi:hypothetical protein